MHTGLGQNGCHPGKLKKTLDLRNGHPMRGYSIMYIHIRGAVQIDKEISGSALRDY